MKQIKENVIKVLEAQAEYYELYEKVYADEGWDSLADGFANRKGAIRDIICILKYEGCFQGRITMLRNAGFGGILKEEEEK